MARSRDEESSGGKLEGNYKHEEKQMTLKISTASASPSLAAPTPPPPSCPKSKCLVIGSPKLRVDESISRADCNQLVRSGEGPELRGIQILYLGSTGKSRKLISALCSELMRSVGEVVRAGKLHHNGPKS